MDYLSEITDAVETFHSQIEQKRVQALGISAGQKPDDLVVPIQKLFMTADVYQVQMEQTIDKVTEMIQKLNEQIESDVTCKNYVVSKQDDIVGDKLIQSCVVVDNAEVYLKKYNATIEKCKENFINAIAPQVQKITKGIDDLTTKYNEEEVDIDAAKMEIEELRTLILSKIKSSKLNREKATTEFGNCIANKGNECETFMRGIYLEFKTLLG